MNNRLHLFQAYGVELEYMIVDKESLAVKPVTDLLFKKITGDFVGDVENGVITWCNELVLHVVELKCTQPEHNLSKLLVEFQENITQVNAHLEEFGAMLLPTAAHPLMDPAKNTFLWPHDNNEIYAAYNKIFNCHGHGWSNLQSTHLNLPFYDDEEFAGLHAAIRLVLPILPALAASSPILGGKDTGFLDKRLDYYQKNQKVVPSITGKVIPERAFSKRQYHKLIYDRIAQDIAPHDTTNILQPVWLNSRGAIARFDRGSIEIRLLDIQECPQADMAIVGLIIVLLKMLVNEELISAHEQQQWEVQPLNDIFQETVKYAENTIITNQEYLKIFGIESQSATAKKVWDRIIALAEKAYPKEMEPLMPPLKVISEQGTLATRILHSLSGEYSTENIKLVYRELSDCLRYNEMFQVWIKEQS
ncbi:carboxylate-amine ligase [Fulvivirga sediminis]|uniref:Glutamate--cysteine ligase n=1 Tax=Fulvivirga sediminis TaxID=2803949 RepID=A0A937JZ08_9BACT|nr:glutamate-cysteine ligase family protein [Fulvivirga sediminis]MBL3656948.1 glutamate--cysteine ligase [Fulvivirga sediminis]